MVYLGRADDMEDAALPSLAVEQTAQSSRVFSILLDDLPPLNNIANFSSRDHPL